MGMTMKRFSVLVITFAFIGSTMANAIQFSVEREGDHLDVVFVTDLTTFRDISRIARQFLEGLSCDVMAGLGDDGALVIRAYNFFTAEETTETDMALLSGGSGIIDIAAGRHNSNND
jgi:hypothetical protein